VEAAPILHVEAAPILHVVEAANFLQKRAGSLFTKWSIRTFDS